MSERANNKDYPTTTWSSSNTTERRHFVICTASCPDQTPLFPLPVRCAAPTAAATNLSIEYVPNIRFPYCIFRLVMSEFRYRLKFRGLCDTFSGVCDGGRRGCRRRQWPWQAAVIRLHFCPSCASHDISSWCVSTCARYK